MGLKPDHWIRKMAQEQAMIEPFTEKQVRQDIISYGLSSYGYDIRVSNQYKIFTNAYSAIVDPKNFDTKSFVDFEGDVCVIPPNSFVLTRSIEYLRIPRSVLTICIGKSSYARCGLIVNVTPLEPSWHGHITLEISNTTPLPAKVYSNEGVAQLVFLEADEECEISYADRQGKYQGQTGVTLPRI
jgi:dCTP deaminase